MRSFLAVSVAPSAPAHLRQPVPAALACLVDDQPVAEQEEATVETAADGWIAVAGADPLDDVGRPGRFVVRLGRAARRAGGDVPTAELAALVNSGSGLAEVMPPFAAAHRDGPGTPVVVAGDWLGLRQLYAYSGDGVAAVSTSARALAVLAGGAIDPIGVGAQAMIGWQIGDATVFAGVTVLPPAARATLAQGRLRVERYAESPVGTGPAPDLDDAVAEMAELLSGWLGRYVEDHPDSVLQLTGGHDSRILLAAIPGPARDGLRTLTLGDPSSADVRIAAALSARYGMDHQVFELDEKLWPTPVEGHELALRAARALDLMASPLALGPLLLAEEQLEQGHRLSGLGGEVARGFYYAGQPAGTTTSAHLVDRLARWRIFANEAVETDALEPAFARQARDTTLARLGEHFAQGDWLRATDEFYLFHRMRRWSGTHSTVAGVRRHFVNPMFDRRFIELALAVAPADKRDSLLLGRLAQRLDPALARIRLDSGLSPARLGTRSAVTRVAARTLTARKVAGKVSQRLRRGRRPQLGAGHASSLVLEHWRAEPAATAALREVPYLRQSWLDEMLAGTRTPAPTTVAFLVNLLAAGR